MGEIRKVINGEFAGSLGDFNGEVLGQPFACVYGEVEPRVAEGHTLIQWPLCGKLHIYVRFNTSEELEKHFRESGEGMVSGSMVFTEELAKHFNIDKNEVLMDALKFINNDYKAESMVSALMGEEIANAMPKDDPLNIFKVVTTKHSGGYYGSGVLASTVILEELREEIGDYYIIPSSLHEVITIPKSMGDQVKGIKEMIREVNTTVVDQQDRLSDNLYSYDSEGLHEL